jgi:hypothetical protein
MYTLQDSANALGITEKTLRTWLSKAGIEPTPDSVDNRRKLLTETQLRYLAVRFRRDPSVLERNQEVLERINNLTDEIERLRRRLGIAGI